jgi:hypothetical protein
VQQNALIKKHDKNSDLQLDDAEMEALLKVQIPLLMHFFLCPRRMQYTSLETQMLTGRYVCQEAVGVETISKSDVKRVRELFQKYSPSDSALDADALSKAISVWDDETNLSEGMFAQGLGLPELRYTLEPVAGQNGHACPCMHCIAVVSCSVAPWSYACRAVR